MRIKTFTIPIIGGEPFVAEMNAFLSSRKVLEIENGGRGGDAAGCKREA
ncbi:MAG: hypothetical protein WA004_12310 [Saprospiraceae bacterium]